MTAQPQTAYPDTAALITALSAASKPVVVFFAEADNEASEFNTLLLDNLRRDRADLDVLVLDKSAHAQIADDLSLPRGPVCLMVRDQVILGYRQGRLSAPLLAQWLDTTLSRTAEDGVPLSDFISGLRTRENRQDQTENAAIARARLLSMTGAGIRTAGGLLLTTAFMGGTMGMAGYAIAGYSAYRGFSVLLDPQKRRPAPPQTFIGKTVDAAASAVTLAGSFALLTFAFNATAGIGFAATAGAALVMMGHGAAGLGRLLPGGLLIGSLRRDADEIARRDPTKPLDEYSPDTPQMDDAAYTQTPAREQDNAPAAKPARKPANPAP